MNIDLLDGTLQIEIFYEREDHDLEDNICLSVVEQCPPAEKIFRAGQTHIYLTPAQAAMLGRALLDAAQQSDQRPGE